MRGNFVAAVVVAALLGAASSVPAYAAQTVVVRVGDVVERAAELDGSEVTFEGEAIGEALRADGDFVWVNVLDEGTAIGVWMPDEMAEQIERFGAYRQTGDAVRVTGVVNLACDRHGGDLDVHATALEVVGPGEPRSERLRPLGALVGAVGFACAGAAALVARTRERKKFEET
ncbi:MAG: ATP-binding protein [Coriobacteriia bacterium]|nr:ATP-binding protein [Coriobacteriia bacterium]